jgi:predicted secreted hydrolase
MSREAIGNAGAAPDHLEVWIDRWRAVQEGKTIHLLAEEKGSDASARWKIDLTLSPIKGPVVHGIEGISKKGEEKGQASHYYSFTRLETTGTIWINGKEERVRGWSWMDHEFSSSVLNPHQVGWDWFSIQLEDGSDYMLFQIRREKGEKDRVSSGTIIAPDGSRRHLTADEFIVTPLQYWKSPASRANYPVGWKIEIPSEHLSLESQPAIPQQELITAKSTRVAYWEGISRFRGTKSGKQITGKGYVELTGYAAPLQTNPQPP